MSKIDEIKVIIKAKVAGIWVPEHDVSGHRYRNTQTGHLQRSVTTKLGVLNKPHLIKWAVRMGVEWLEKEDRFMKLGNEHWRDEMVTGAQLAHIDVRDEAGGVGHQAHDIIERYINEWIASGTRPEDIRTFADPSKTDPRAVASSRAVEAMFVKHNVVPIASELLVGNLKYSAGTLDFLCFWEGKLALLDWKTSNAVDKINYPLQVSAYTKFFQEMTGLKIKVVKIIHLSKDYDKFELWRVLKIDLAYKAFKNVCAIYDWMNSNDEKIEKDIKRLTI